MAVGKKTPSPTRSHFPFRSGKHKTPLRIFGNGLVGDKCQNRNPSLVSTEAGGIVGHPNQDWYMALKMITSDIFSFDDMSEVSVGPVN